MKKLLINKLKMYELTKRAQHKIWAAGSKLDGCLDTDGDEDCLPVRKEKGSGKKGTGEFSS